MSDEYKIPYNKEYSVTVEDALVRVMVYEKNDSYLLEEDRHPLSLLHSHMYTELFICTSGTLIINTEHGYIQLSANDAVIIPAHMVHTKSDLPSDAEWQSIAFSLHKRSSVEKSDFFKTINDLCSSKDAVILRNRPELCTAVSNLSKMPNVFLPLPALRMCLCLAEIADTYKAESVLCAERKPTPTDINHSSKLEYIIEAYYNGPLTSDRVAKLMCISKRQLSRIVQKCYGTTLHNVIMKKRLSVAAFMLENTDSSIQEISSAVGFGDVSAFRREFRSFYAATPTEYRELMHNSKIKRD